MSTIDFMDSMSRLYDRHMASVSTSFHLTAMELSILLFLGNNPKYDTAKEIVEKRHLTKSHVSLSLRTLEEKGLIRKEHRDGNHRTTHLVLLPESKPILQAGQEAQRSFLSLLTKGLSEEEIEHFQGFVERIHENVLKSLQEEGERGQTP